MKKQERLKRIASKVTTTRHKQVGNIRFEDKVYEEIVKIANGLGITKQYLIEQIVKDFLIED